MRDMIVQRINDIRAWEGGFSKDTMRWKNCMYQNQHISNIDLDIVTDADLLNILELVIRVFYKQIG